MTRALALGVLASLGCGIGIVGGAAQDGSIHPGQGDAAPGTPGISPDGGGSGDGGNAVGLDGGDAGNSSVVHAGGALSLSRANNQFVNIANIAIPSDFTLETWVKPASLGSEMMIVAEDRSPLQFDNQFRLAITATGTLYFMMTDAAANTQGLAIDSTQTGPFSLSTSSPLVIGRWTHVAVTKLAGLFFLYVDGSVVSSFVASGGGTFARNNAFDFRIGARMGNGGPANHFDGAIDDTRLYSTARSGQEIAGDRATALPAGSPARSGLIRYWRFDEGEGNLANDDVGAYDGTLMNGASWVTSDAF